jgi:hypothetical protein
MHAIPTQPRFPSNLVRVENLGLVSVVCVCARVSRGGDLIGVCPSSAVVAWLID